MMKKSLVFAVVVLLLCFSTSVWGQDDVREGGYIGVGGSYAVEDFDVDGPSYDSTWGLNVRAGYDFAKWLSLEFDFCYLPDFTDKYTFSRPFPESDPPVTLPMVEEVDLTVTTYMVVAKLSHFDSEILKPYVLVGGGLMREEYVGKRLVLGSPLGEWSGSNSDLCAKLGLGADFYANKNVSFGVEGNYVWGFGDVDLIRYFNLTFGVAYHF